MQRPDKLILGWREWLALPDLGISEVKAKVDTGARLSCLNAFFVDKFSVNGTQRVRFGLHPKQADSDIEIVCETDMLDERWVTDAGGRREMRVVIETRVVIAGRDWPIELTLSNHDTARFRMVLGRSAMGDQIMVDPHASYLLGEHPTTKPGG